MPRQIQYGQIATDRLFSSLYITLYHKWYSTNNVAQLPLNIRNRLRSQNNWKWLSVAGAVAMLCGVWVLVGPLYYNGSPSIPAGWYALQVQDTLGDGDIVRLCLPPAIGRYAVRRGYVHRGTCDGGSRRIGKPVVAAAGDTLVISSRGVQVNGGPLLKAPLQRRDRRGKLMPRAVGRQILQPGECFLLSTFNQLSFDSRYYGPVPCRSPFQVLRKVL